MGKLLKVLVVFIFLFSIGALVLGIFNFGKREMLIGRAHELEQRIINLAKTLEAKDPVFEGIADYPERDTDPVTDRVIDNPGTHDFWNSYANVLEVTGEATMNLDTDAMRLRLRQYYYIDPATGKTVKDPLRGSPRTDGPDTMSALLDQVQERAVAQYNALNKTRNELTQVRQELIVTIREVNSEKRLRRENLRRITELQAQVTRLEGEKTDLERKVAQLEREKADLVDQVATLEADLGKAKEEFEDLKKQYASLQKRYEDLLSGPVATAGTRREFKGDVASGVISPGAKGRILQADPDWAFVIVQLTDESMVELLGPDKDQPLPEVEFMVRRPGLDGEAGDFVTRIRLKSVKRDGSNLAMADNLQNWEQIPVNSNDEVFF